MPSERIESSQSGRQDDGLRAKTSERRRDGAVRMSENGMAVRPLMSPH